MKLKSLVTIVILMIFGSCCHTKPNVKLDVKCIDEVDLGDYGKECRKFSITNKGYTEVIKPACNFEPFARCAYSAVATKEDRALIEPKAFENMLINAASYYCMD